MADFLKNVVDPIFGTSREIRKYEMNNPGETVLAADASKGIITSGGQVTRGLDWVTSQRAVVVLTNKKLVCGKWTIPLEQIAEAKLIRITTLFGRSQVLHVKTRDNVNYQFGMQLNPQWTEQQALPILVENGKVKTSLFSMAVRIFAIVYLLYLIYERFSGN